MIKASRRRFLQYSAALTAIPLAGRAEHACEAPSQVAAAVVEAGSAPCLRFGERCLDGGVVVHEIRDDVTTLWYRHLEPQWRGAPAAIVGMTRWPALFCLEELARQHGLRVVHHSVHRPGAHADTVHEAVHSAARVNSQRRAADDAWPETVANALARVVLLPRQRAAARTYMPKAHDDDVRTLHSWVIAPVTLHKAA